MIERSAPALQAIFPYWRKLLVHYLMFGLTIQVGADVLGTAVSPTVADLGALAGIVLIRATLSYFLSKDLERGVEETQEERRKDETEL